MLIDSHCHFNTLSVGDRENVISAVSAFPIICLDSSIDVKTTKESVALAGRYPFIYTAIGFHPFSAAEFREDTIDKYEKIIDENKKIIALGEIGLDSNCDVDFDVQEKILRDFISLSRKKNLPVIIHNRMPDLRILKALDDFFSSYERVIFHCFSYGEEVLAEVLKKGGMVSFSLNILRNRKDIISSLKKCPLEHLLLETDSPYMRIKGVSSTPLDIEKVYKFAGQVKEIPIEKLEAAVFSNAQRLFLSAGG